MRVWNRNNDGTLVSSTEVADMDEARKLAREWNKGKPWKRVDVIANAEKTAEATKVCATY